MTDLCPTCSHELRVGDWPWCPHGSGHGHSHMAPYTVDIDGTPITISSIQDANRIERETMARYRNGEGAPLVFRSFHQDSSNRDRNTLDGLGVRQQTPNRTRRGLPIAGGSFRPDEG